MSPSAFGPVERNITEGRNVTDGAQVVVVGLPSRCFLHKQGGTEAMEETSVAQAEENAVNAEEVSLKDKDGMRHDPLKNIR